MIETAGRLRVMASFTTPVEDVFHDVRILLTAAEDASVRLEGPRVRRAPVVPNTPSRAAGYVTIVNQATGCSPVGDGRRGGRRDPRDAKHVGRDDGTNPEDRATAGRTR